MSFDRKIDQLCTHRVECEALYLLSDRVTVKPLRPIAAAAATRVWINGSAEVPSQGVHLPADATGARVGPFDIQLGVNDSLLIQVDDGPTQTLTAPTGKRVTTKLLADELSRQINGLRFRATTRGRLRLDTSRKGPAARIYLDPTSTLLDTVGLPGSRAWRGRTSYPGWTLINDPNTLTDLPTRLIVFDEPIPGFRDYVEISYTTVRTECRRCGGLGIEHDWRINTKGDVIEVRDEALLIQEVLKVFYTIQGSNPFHNWYGTGLLNTIAKKISAAGILQSFIVSDIQEAFRRWQTIKQQQEEKVGQFVSDPEFPFRLLSVNLEPSDKDPTVIFVNSVIQSRSSRPIQISRGIRLPEPVDLLGSTAQQGVFRQSLRDPAFVG